jgi:hypothetical protein
MPDLRRRTFPRVGMIGRSMPVLRPASSSAMLPVHMATMRAPADIFDRSLRLVHHARVLCRQAEWAQASRRRPIQGAADGPGADVVAAVIQAKVAAGLLPRDGGATRLRVGLGSGNACDGCEGAITKDQREYEIDPPGWPTIRLHHECLEHLLVERINRVAQQ